MKLVRLILENIKSYQSETIDFYDGVNFISGINGAGKTTLIEAIGYALFDSNPFSSQKQFIRQGEKSGSITVVIEAADERLYRIVRRLREPSGGSWAVYDEDSGAELNELHGNQDVKAWLAVNLGIGAGLDPVRLFEDVIGISQGKFITPFLERPKERKKTFNTILQLESYREAFDKSSTLAAKIKDRIYEKEGEKKALQVKVEDLDECREKLKENQERFLVLENIQKELAAEISSLQEEIKIQEGYRLESEKNRRELHTLGIRLAAISSRKESLLAQAKEADINRQKAFLAEAGHHQYEEQRQIADALEKKRKIRDLLNTKLQEQKNRLISLQVEITSGKQNRDQMIQQLNIEKSETVQEGEKLSGEREQFSLRQKNLQAWQLRFAEHKLQCGSIQQAYNLAEQVKAVFAAREDNYRQLLSDKANLTEALKKLAEKENAVADVLTLEHKLEQVRGEINKNKARMSALQENSKASNSGMCPFLETQCLNVQGNLHEHFEREKDKLSELNDELDSQEKAVLWQLKQAKTALEEFYILQHQQKQYGKLLDQEREILETLKSERESMAAAIDPHQIMPLSETLLECEEYFSETMINSDPDLDLIGKKLRELLSRYMELHREASTKQEPVLSALGEIKDLSEDFWTKLERVVNNSIQGVNSTLAGYDTRLDSLRERYRKINQQLNEMIADKRLEAKENELRMTEQEMQGISEKLKDYLSLDADYKDSQETLGKYEPAYIQYMQNYESILKYDALCGQIEEAGREESRHTAEEAALKEALQRAEQLYKPDLLPDLRKRAEIKIKEKGGVENDLGHAAKEVENLTRQVREKELIQNGILALEKEIKNENKAQELLRLIRQIFNQSGEEIAELYRQHLSREANFIYQQIAKENVTLNWGEDFELRILESRDKNDSGRSFAQLSGGEKMTAALAVRLALLNQLSGLGIGIFDEPTANLDENRRSNLARIIPQVTKDFNQLFVISHDDTFDAITENVIHLRKDISGTKVVS